MANISIGDYVDNYKISGVLGAFGNKNTILSSSNAMLNVNSALHYNNFGNNSSINLLNISTRAKVSSVSILSVSNAKYIVNPYSDLIKTNSKAKTISAATVVTTMFVKSAGVTNFVPNHSIGSFIYVCPNNFLAISTDKSYDKKITKLTDEEFQFNIEFLENNNNGFDDIGISLVSGKHCEIKLNNTTGVTISNIDNLPSSLKYDEDTSTILGIPFLVGTFVTKITLSNNKVSTIIFNITPISLNRGL